MKRRREELDLEDTGASFREKERRIRSRRMGNENAFSVDLDRLLLTEMIGDRKREGRYKDVTGWDDFCWTLVLRRLSELDARFRRISKKALKDRQSQLCESSTVDFSSLNPPPPGGDLDQLLYKAFKDGPLGVPPKQNQGTRRPRSRGEEVNVTVNNYSTRISTTNINNNNGGGGSAGGGSCGGGGSCSNTSYMDNRVNLADLLLEVKGELPGPIFVELSKHGDQYPVFNRMRVGLSRAAFIQYLKDYVS